MRRSEEGHQVSGSITLCCVPLRQSLLEPVDGQAASNGPDSAGVTGECHLIFAQVLGILTWFLMLLPQELLPPEPPPQPQVLF